MPETAWYTNMAAAMKNRERCLTAIEKWQGLLAEAEAEIQTLRESDVADEPAATPETSSTNNSMFIAPETAPSI